MPSTVLILGARGRFGLAVARAFAAAGWRVLGQVRAGASVAPEEGISWLALDLQDTAAIAQAAVGAAVVVHALNPVYTSRAWRTLALPMLEVSISLARTLGSTVMLPGNVYNFGAAMPALLREDTAQAAHTTKGRVRVTLEQRLAQSGVRSVVIRAGDFFGSGKGTSFDLMLVKNLSKGVITTGANPDVATPWAYLPDLAKTFVRVAEQRDVLSPFAVLHFAGHQIAARQWRELLTPIARRQGWIAAQDTLKLRSIPWGLLRLVGLVVPMVASLVEMRYLGATPHALANDRLRALIGEEPRTALDQAIAAALQDLGMVADPLTSAAA